MNPKTRRMWLVNLVIETGNPPDVVLRNLLEEYRKIDAIAAVVGVGPDAVSSALKSYGIKPIKNHRSIAEVAESCGMTEVEMLEMFAKSGDKFTVIAAEIGVTHQAVIRAMRKHGIVKESCRAIEWRGVRDTMAGHCERHGISMKAVGYARQYKRMGKAEALEWAARGVGDVPKHAAA